MFTHRALWNVYSQKHLNKKQHLSKFSSVRNYSYWIDLSSTGRRFSCNETRELRKSSIRHHLPSERSKILSRPFDKPNNRTRNHKFAGRNCHYNLWTSLNNIVLATINCLADISEWQKLKVSAIVLLRLVRVPTFFFGIYIICVYI